MRLLNTSNLKLYEFHDADIPDYAIMSHTWTKQEVSLQKLEDPNSRELAGYTKIQRCCKIALSEGWKYAWIDTCCIDKTSSADLSEAINAMYRWYEKAQVCYVYLADVSATNFETDFIISRWFFRGWTLQELLAPQTVVFYGRNWEELGTKWSLKDKILRATGITLFEMIDHRRASIATKMSWAALRETTRVEDTAYCLLGLFDINMPLLYGEGSKAFMRLQHEILQNKEDDESIFAWTDRKRHDCGLLASSPAAFALSGDIVPVKTLDSGFKPPSITKRLLTMDGFDSKAEYQLHDSIQYPKNPSPYIILNCAVQNPEGYVVGIELTERSLEYYETSSSGKRELCSVFLDYFVRSSPGKLMQCESFRGFDPPQDPNHFRKTMKISLDHVSLSPPDQKQRFAAILPSLADAGFEPSQRHPENEAFVELPSVFPLKFRPEGWKVILDLSRLSVAAMMFRSENEAFAVILSAIESGVNVDIAAYDGTASDGTEWLKHVFAEDSLYRQRRAIADRSDCQLQVNHTVSATSRKKYINYETVYFIDIKISALQRKSSLPNSLNSIRYLPTPLVDPYKPGNGK